jgi:transcriptional regulator with XRE-family HTH domain
MITIEQIRAGRALIDWSQGDLAEYAGLSQTGIARIENGTNKPNTKTIEKILAAFDAAGVEFIGERGVQRKSNEVKVFRGQQGFVSFINDVYETVKTFGGEICVSNVDERLFLKWLGDSVHGHVARMQELSHKAGFTFKILVQEGDENQVASYATYRGVKPEMFGNAPFYVYGDKLAILLFNEDVSVFVIESKEIAEAQRKQFKITWDAAG